MAHHLFEICISMCWRRIWMCVVRKRPGVESQVEAPQPFDGLRAFDWIL